MAHVHLFTLDFFCCPVTQPILWNPRAAPHCQRHLCSECLWNHSSLIPFYRAWICWLICCVVYSPRVSCLWNSSPWEYVFSYHTFPTQTLGFFKSLEWKTDQISLGPHTCWDLSRVTTGYQCDLPLQKLHGPFPAHHRRVFSNLYVYLCTGHPTALKFGYAPFKDWYQEAL